MSTQNLLQQQILKGHKSKRLHTSPPQKNPNDWDPSSASNKERRTTKKIEKIVALSLTLSLSHTQTQYPLYHTPPFVVSDHDHPPKRGRFDPNSGEPTIPCLLCNDPDRTLPESVLRGSHSQAHHHESYSASTRRGSRQRRPCSGLGDTMRALLLSPALSERTKPFGADPSASAGGSITGGGCAVKVPVSDPSLAEGFGRTHVRVRPGELGGEEWRLAVRRRVEEGLRGSV